MGKRKDPSAVKHNVVSMRLTDRELADMETCRKEMGYADLQSLLHHVVTCGVSSVLAQLRVKPPTC